MPTSKFNKLIKSYKDFPKKGVSYKDFSPLAFDPIIRSEVKDYLLSEILKYSIYPIQAIVAIDSRGYIFGSILANTLGIHLIQARKYGKTPGIIVYGNIVKAEYNNEIYEIPKEHFSHVTHVHIHDDVVATGNTLKSLIELFKSYDKVVISCSCIIRLKEFNNIPEEVNLISVVEI